MHIPLAVYPLSAGSFKDCSLTTAGVAGSGPGCEEKMTALSSHHKPPERPPEWSVLMLTAIGERKRRQSLNSLLYRYMFLDK